MNNNRKNEVYLNGEPLRREVRSSKQQSDWGITFTVMVAAIVLAHFFFFFSVQRMDVVTHRMEEMSRVIHYQERRIEELEALVDSYHGKSAESMSATTVPKYAKDPEKAPTKNAGPNSTSGPGPKSTSRPHTYASENCNHVSKHERQTDTRWRVSDVEYYSPQ